MITASLAPRNQNGDFGNRATVIQKL